MSSSEFSGSNMKLIHACAASGCAAPFGMHQLSIQSSVSGAPRPHCTGLRILDVLSPWRASPFHACDTQVP